MSTSQSRSQSREPERLLPVRVRSVYTKELCPSYSPGIDPWPTTFECQRTEFGQENGTSCAYTPERARERAETWCRALFDMAHDRQAHVSKLDAAFASYVQCQYLNPPAGMDVVKEACSLLERLPSTPLVSEDLFGIVSTPRFSDYYHADARPQLARPDLLSTELWARVRVVTFINTNIVRMALHIVQYCDIDDYNMTTRGWHVDEARVLVDTTAELLKAATKLSDNSDRKAERQVWFIVKAFLWASWQRSMMLLYYFILGQHLKLGYDSHNEKLDLRSYISSHAPKTSSQSPPTQLQNTKQAKYMCTWALNILRTDRAAIGQDYRSVHDRFSRLFGNTPARCNQGSAVPCTGRGPESCQRFTGMKIEDQSAHDSTCQGQCSNLIWDETSYRGVHGARAVSIEETSSTQLRYCAASKNTLAISHVWSHGQGGRPESGFNACLHRRYAGIARSFKCSSYWMDTPCIPEDHQLRAESIARINDVFTESKLTLVCDRDLMEIEIEKHFTLELKERILAVLLVCDWNVRSWTFLESMRGRRNVHLLCKDNVAISLMDTLKFVHREGAVDLVIHFLGTQHLVPPATLTGPDPSARMLQRGAGFVRPEEAACLLGFRHASRPGDDMVIWSLLCQERAHGSAEAFWKARIHDPEVCHPGQDRCDCFIDTGFLISSQPRLHHCKGFTWAPARPCPEVVVRRGRDRRYQAFDGRDTVRAQITKDGLRGEWMMYEFESGKKDELHAGKKRAFLHRLQLRDPQQVRQTKVLDSIRDRSLCGYTYGALLQPSNAVGGPWQEPVGYRGSIEGVLFAVVGSHDRWGWEWKGVFEWDRSITLPKMIHTDYVLDPFGQRFKGGILLA